MDENSHTTSLQNCHIAASHTTEQLRESVQQSHAPKTKKKRIAAGKRWNRDASVAALMDENITGCVAAIRE